jgi:hypothetical protein
MGQGAQFKNKHLQARPNLRKNEMAKQPVPNAI